MSIIEIGWHFVNDWSLLRCIRALDGLGYTRQERRRIVHGWVSAQNRLHPIGTADALLSNNLDFAPCGSRMTVG